MFQNETFKVNHGVEAFKCKLIPKGEIISLPFPQCICQNTLRALGCHLRCLGSREPCSRGQSGAHEVSSGGGLNWRAFDYKLIFGSTSVPPLNRSSYVECLDDMQRMSHNHLSQNHKATVGLVMNCSGSCPGLCVSVLHL